MSPDLAATARAVRSRANSLSKNSSFAHHISSIVLVTNPCNLSVNCALVSSSELWVGTPGVSSILFSPFSALTLLCLALLVLPLAFLPPMLFYSRYALRAAQRFARGLCQATGANATAYALYAVSRGFFFPRERLLELD